MEAQIRDALKVVSAKLNDLGKEPLITKRDILVLLDCIPNCG